MFYKVKIKGLKTARIAKRRHTKAAFGEGFHEYYRQIDAITVADIRHTSSDCVRIRGGYPSAALKITLYPRRLDIHRRALDGLSGVRNCKNTRAGLPSGARNSVFCPGRALSVVRSSTFCHARTVSAPRSGVFCPGRILSALRKRQADICKAKSALRDRQAGAAGSKSALRNSHPGAAGSKSVPRAYQSGGAQK